MTLSATDIKINEITLEDNYFADPFYICNVQLESPFWKEIEEKEAYGDKYLLWHEYYIQKRTEKIVNILSGVEKEYINNKKKIKVLVFPEYSIEERMLHYFDNFVDKNNIVIIAGDYDKKERNAFAHIIYKSNDKVNHCKQYKLSPSRFDEEYLGELSNEKKVINRFIWHSSSGIENMMTIYICHDYLEYYCITSNKSISGLYIVVMCSPKIDEFYGLSSVIMRSIIGNKSNVVMLCNASFSPEKKHKKQDEPCGQSQIIGPIKNRCVMADNGEGGILAQISLNTVATRHTRIPNAEVINNVIIFSVDKNGNFIKDDRIEYEGKMIINPNALLKDVEMRKIYALYCIKNYFKFIETLKNIPLQSIAIFGVYDILIKSYEEGVGFFEKRLSSYLGDKYHELSDSDLLPRKIYQVTDILKYRGEVLCEINNNGDITYLHKYTGSDTCYYENIEHIKNIISNNKNNNITNVNKYKELEKSGILMKVKYDSDLFPSDISKGYEEHLVFVDIYSDIYSYNEKAKSSASKEFKRIVLPALINESRIRTIEHFRENPDGEHINNGGYIIHLVGTLRDVREIIIKNIHEHFGKEEVRCRSLVVPVAETLSKDKNLHLEEKMIRVPRVQRFVLDMIPYMKFVDPKNPFIIKQIDIEIVNIIHDIYVDYRKMFESVEDKGEMMNKLNRFVYGICFAYKHSDDDVRDVIVRYCKDAFILVETEIQKYFIHRKELMRKETENMSDLEKNNFINLRANKDKNISDIIYTQTVILSDIIDAVKIGINLHLADEQKLFKDIKMLSGFLRYKNKLLNSYPKQTDKRKDVIGLANAMLNAIKFIKLYDTNK